MKLLKIFGVAAAVHAAGFLCLVAIPGCRSTTRQTSPSASREPALPPPTSSSPGLNSGAASPSSPNGVSSSGSGTDLNPGVPPSGDAGVYGSSPGIHFNPTRPGSPAANVLQTGPAADVTPATTYTVVKGDTLSGVAKKQGVTMAALVAANNLKKEAGLRLGQKLIIPTKPAPAPAPVAGTTPALATPSLGGGDTLTYEVKTGENLATIAKHNGTTVSALRSLNKLKNDQVRVGQKLIVPAAATAVSNAAPVVDADGAAAAAKPAAAAASAGTPYTVKPGETLAQIAKKFGVRLSDIATANNISDPSKLRAGHVIIIPAASSGKTSASTAKGAATSTARTAPATTPAPAPEPVSPVGPAPTSGPAEPVNPISAPPAGDAPPPINKVEDTSPVGPSKS